MDKVNERYTPGGFVLTKYDGVKEYLCKWCYEYKIDDGGNVPDPFTCWKCWETINRSKKHE